MNTLTSYANKRASQAFLAFMLTLVTCVLTPISNSFAQTYSGPIVITKGGTYTGNWESRDSEVSAVEIRTNEPVVIVNSNIRGAGPLIRSLGNSADITIRHTNGYGLTPTPWVNYKKARRFLGVDVFRNIVVENCYMENTAGIYIGQRYEGNGSSGNAIKIRYNKAKNIDGRVYGGQTFAQFVQFNYRNVVPHVEVAWNQVINEAGNSAVEDNINIYNTKGAPGSLIKIHNNYIEGAYPIPHTGATYSGGGIITDGDGDISIAPAYIEANDNHLVNLGNYSMGIAGGNNVRYHHNRAINSATFKNGSRFSMYTSGLWSKDYYKKNTTFANSVDNNTVAINAWGYTNNRNDVSVAEDASFTNNNFLPGTVTLQMEADEFSRWNQKLQQNGIVLGPNGSAGAPPAPTPNQAPNVAITSPTAGASVTAGNAITLTANATDADGKVTRVEYFAGATKLGEATVAPFSYNWANAATGSYSLTAKATDDKGATKVSAAVAITVVAAPVAKTNQAPSIAITSPKASDSFTAGNAITITADASDADGTIKKVEFFSGTTKLGETTTAPYTYSWTSAAAGSYSLTAKATDDKGATTSAAEVAITVTAAATAGPTPTPPAPGTTPPSGGAGGTPTADGGYLAKTAYPNPFKDVIILDLSAKKVALQRVVLKNQTGRTVYEEKGSLALIDDKLEINLSGTKLKDGLYYIMFTDTQGNTEAIKIIKE